MLKNKKIINKKIVIIAAVALVIIGSSGVYAFTKQQDAKPSQPEAAQTEQSVEIADQNIDMNPATETEKQETEKQKANVGNQPTLAKDPATGKKQVSPVITYASQEGEQVTVNAFVGSIVENGGVCTAEFTKEATKFSKKSEAIADASNTICSPFFVNINEFNGSGGWNVVIYYDSASSNGKSAAKAFTIN